MWELDYKESWAPKNWCFWTVMMDKTLENPLDPKEIQPVYPKENQSQIFIGRTDAEAEIPIIWPPHAKNWLLGKDPDAGKDWRQEEKGMTEDEMGGWTWVWVSSGSWWCHPTISSSFVLFSCLESLPASGSFPRSQFFASNGQSIGASASASVLPMNIQDSFPLGWTDWISLQSKGISRVFCNHSSKASILQHSAF